MPDKSNKAKAKVAKSRHPAQVVALKREFPPAQQPAHLNDADAIRLVRMIAADSDNIVVITHAKKRKAQRSIHAGPDRAMRAAWDNNGGAVHQ